MSSKFLYKIKRNTKQFILLIPQILHKSSEGKMWDLDFYDIVLTPKILQMGLYSQKLGGADISHHFQKYTSLLFPFINHRVKQFRKFLSPLQKLIESTSSFQLLSLDSLSTPSYCPKMTKLLAGFQLPAPLEILKIEQKSLKSSKLEKSIESRKSFSFHVLQLCSTSAS